MQCNWDWPYGSNVMNSKWLTLKCQLYSYTHASYNYVWKSVNQWIFFKIYWWLLKKPFTSYNYVWKSVNQWIFFKIYWWLLKKLFNGRGHLVSSWLSIYFQNLRHHFCEMTDVYLVHSAASTVFQNFWISFNQFLFRWWFYFAPYVLLQLVP